MKTAEEIADEIFDPRRWYFGSFDRADLLYILGEYGAQVREEAAKIARSNGHIGSAEVIEKMELP